MVEVLHCPELLVDGAVVGDVVARVVVRRLVDGAHPDRIYARLGQVRQLFGYPWKHGIHISRYLTGSSKFKRSLQLIASLDFLFPF